MPRRSIAATLRVREFATRSIRDSLIERLREQTPNVQILEHVVGKLVEAAAPDHVVHAAVQAQLVAFRLELEAARRVGDALAVVVAAVDR